MNQSGFTLIEVLLSVAIIAMLVGVSLPIYETYARRNDLDLTAQGTAAMLRRATTYARAVNKDSIWSVKVEPTRLTLFQGATFASRDTTNDEVIQIPESVIPSGVSEIQFAKLSAAPNITGSITLTSSTNDVRTVTINAKGSVDY